MFGDYAKVFKTINSTNDQHTLQNDLDYLTPWSRENKEYAYNLKIDNTAHKLGEIEEQKYIGVIVDSNLEFDKHIKN